MNRRGNVNSIAFRDLLLGMNLMLAVLLGLILVQINPKASDSAQIDPPGNVVVSIAWPAGKTDIDLWVSGPGQEKATGYSNRGGRTFNLLRDDLGVDGDTTPFNHEEAYSRGLPDGEYIVNIHSYSAAEEVPVSVEVRMATDGGVAALVKEVVTLRPRQERTVVRFRLAGGNVVPGSVNNIWFPLRSAK